MDGLLRGIILDEFFAPKMRLVQSAVSSLVTAVYSDFGCAGLRAYEMAV